MKNKNILVIGGAGFIGSNLCERLVADNTVFCFDDYSTGSDENHIEGVHYYKGGTYHQVLDLLYGNNIELVYHLGEYSRVEQSFDDYEKCFKSNLDGTRNVLEYVKKHNIKLVYAGSSTKFTNEHTGYIQSPYAWSKKTNTELVIKYGEWFGLDYAITYFYNVYGNREIETGQYATLIAKYKRLMADNQPLPVVEPGIQRRNFTHIDDTIDALVLIGEFGHGDEYGIGSPESYTVKEVAELFGGEIQVLPPRKGNRFAAEVHTEKTRQLGWEPKRRLSDYITKLKKRNWK